MVWQVAVSIWFCDWVCAGYALYCGVAAGEPGGCVGAGFSRGFVSAVAFDEICLYVRQQREDEDCEGWAHGDFGFSLWYRIESVE